MYVSQPAAADIVQALSRLSTSLKEMGLYDELHARYERMNTVLLPPRAADSTTFVFAQVLHDLL